jgi:hypothetical protein
MMPGMSGVVDWRKLAFELVVVFIGLFAALQVDSCRESRKLERAETASLSRLRDDLRDFLARTEPILEQERGFRDAVVHVRRSLVAGRILDADTAQFEYGLLRVGHLPSPALNRTTYDELVAAGMFARLSSDELKRAVSSLYAQEEMTQRNFAWWRDTPQQLMYDFERLIEYEGEEPSPGVRFDFDALRESRTIKNGFFWAADTHNDWIDKMEILVSAARNAEALVTAELRSRRS